MPKALMAGVHGQTLASGEEWVIGANFNGTTEAQSQYSCTEDASFTGLRGNVFSGNSGTATFQFRDTGGNGANVAAITGTGAFEDTTPHTDSLTAGDTFNGAYTDTGTDSVVLTVGCNVEFASGHGNFHAASGAGNLVMDVGSAVRYLPIHGICAADGVAVASIATVQFLVREYTSIEAFQIRINANARLNDSVFSVNVNGVDVGTPITFATLATGLQVVTETNALVPGDLVCISLTLGAGVEDLNFGFLGVTFKSTGNASAAGYVIQAGSARTASDTPSYYSFGGGATATLANAQFKVGFPARCQNLRCYIAANTYSADATLSLMVDGVAKVTQTITAGAASQWFENTVGSYDILDTENVCFMVTGGGSGSITIHQIWVGFGYLASNPDRTVAAAGGGIGHGRGRGGRKRRRILLDDGTIWEPATEADFQDYIAALICSFEAKLPPPLEPPAKPRRKRYKAAVKSLAEIPRLMVQRPLPTEFYKALDNNNADVLNSRLLAQAWADYMAEVEEDEDLTMLLLS